MTTDDFIVAASERAATIYRGDWDAFNQEPVDDGGFSESERSAFRNGAAWARDHPTAQEQEVTIRHEEGKPSTCEVRRGGVLIFSGRDHGADLRVAQEPTDAESLLDTDAGLALANAAWKEGASTMLRSVNDHEGGPWEKPGSPYSAPLLARIAARRDEEGTEHATDQ